MPVKVKKRDNRKISAKQAQPDTLYEITNCDRTQHEGLVVELILSYDRNEEELVPEEDYLLILGSENCIYRSSETWETTVLRELQPGDTLVVS